jgi:hypothetical protein
MSPSAQAGLGIMVKELDAQLDKGDDKGAWTCVVDWGS